ncbi:hypothetical protein [Hymenobacter baengnokdamensis]|uniref:hypothetical protein n=1 Tax=Hymenobacter baengnokdamensis TaxID=2615203 RepID=UPI00124706A0|nr:hypothetical protein [Hymenobacter baengnokdamensis]
MKFLKKLPVRVVFLLPFVLGLLSSCAVYDHIFHPHRLPTPKMNPELKAKVKAAEKARHKGTSLKPAETTTDEAAGAGGSAGSAEPGAPAAPAGAAPAEEKKKTMSYSELPTGTKVKYDKHLLIKKSWLERILQNRRKLHHYDTRPLTPREASRENRRIRKHGHTKGDKGGDTAPGKQKGSVDPALDPGPDPGPPAAAPTQPSVAPDPAPAPKPAKTKAKKVPVPKPDPTQPAPGQ